MLQDGYQVVQLNFQTQIMEILKSHLYCFAAMLSVQTTVKHKLHTMCREMCVWLIACCNGGESLGEFDHFWQLLWILSSWVEFGFPSSLCPLCWLMFCAFVNMSAATVVWMCLFQELLCYVQLGWIEYCSVGKL